MILTLADMWDFRANPRRESQSSYGHSRDRQHASEMDLISNLGIVVFNSIEDRIRSSR
jgi:hypothetical protein